MSKEEEVIVYGTPLLDLPQQDSETESLRSTDMNDGEVQDSVYLFKGNTKRHTRLACDGDMCTVITGKLVGAINPVKFQPDDITQLITRDMYKNDALATNKLSTTQYLLQIAKLLSFPPECEKTLADANFESFIGSQLIDVEDLQSIFHARCLLSQLIWAYESSVETIPVAQVKFKASPPKPPKPIGQRITHPTTCLTDRLKRTYPFTAARLHIHKTLMEEAPNPYDYPFSTTSPLKRLKQAIDLLEHAERDAEKRTKGTARNPFIF
jgi:hypothetical protein